MKSMDNACDWEIKTQQFKHIICRYDKKTLQAQTGKVMSDCLWEAEVAMGNDGAEACCFSLKLLLYSLT